MPLTNQVLVLEKVSINPGLYGWPLESYSFPLLPKFIANRGISIDGNDKESFAKIKRVWHEIVSVGQRFTNYEHFVIRPGDPTRAEDDERIYTEFKLRNPANAGDFAIRVIVEVEVDVASAYLTYDISI